MFEGWDAVVRAGAVATMFPHHIPAFSIVQPAFSRCWKRLAEQARGLINLFITG
jgi:hypothetical protein